MSVSRVAVFMAATEWQRGCQSASCAKPRTNQHFRRCPDPANSATRTKWLRAVRNRPGRWRSRRLDLLPQAANICAQPRGEKPMTVLLLAMLVALAAPLVA